MNHEQRRMGPGRAGMIALSLTAMMGLAAAETVEPGLLPGVTVEKLADGYKSLEGPAWDAAKGELVFSDQGRGIEYVWRPGKGVGQRRDLRGKVNGHAFDHEGRLITCESKAKRVTRLEPDGTYTVLADAYEGQPLNAPNDVVVAPDGSVWFTDPNFGMKSGGDRQFVYRYDPKTGELRNALPEGFRPNKPNGLGFSPDGTTFYLNNNGANRVEAFDVTDGGELTNRRVLAGALDRWPDGMAVHPKTGELFVALFSSKALGNDGQGINVFSPEGEFKGRIPVPGTTTNCCFGGEGMTKLYITSGPGLYVADLSGRLSR